MCTGSFSSSGSDAKTSSRSSGFDWDRFCSRETESDRIGPTGSDTDRFALLTDLDRLPLIGSKLIGLCSGNTGGSGRDCGTRMEGDTVRDGGGTALADL